MARPASTDFLQSHKFALVECPPFNDVSRRVFVERKGPIISCANISIPDVQIELQDITEGTEPFGHKVMTGRAQTGDCEITYAVIPAGGTDLYSWIRRAAYGIGVPRRSFMVYHFRNQAIQPNGELADESMISRRYILEGCLPISHKLAADLDATDDAISLESLSMHVWRIRLKIPATVPTATFTGPLAFGPVAQP